MKREYKLTITLENGEQIYQTVAPTSDLVIGSLRHGDIVADQREDELIQEGFNPGTHLIFGEELS